MKKLQILLKKTTKNYNKEKHMDLTELKNLIDYNEKLLEEAIKNNNSRRIAELLGHRAVLKDTVIEILLNKEVA